MIVLIIEDEDLTAEDLIHTLRRVNPSITIEKRLSNVDESIQYFKNGTKADLIFSDIQLGDGQSFEIFDAIKPQIPVVFCTAYDNYMQEAFQNFGLDYLLKPFSEDSIRSTLEKYHHLKHALNKNVFQLLDQLQIQERNKATRRSIVVIHADRIIPILCEDIALCYIEYENVYIVLNSHEQYIVNKSLEEMELLLGVDCFRVNRQYIVRRNAISYASYGLGRKLNVQLNLKLPAKITVSKDKSQQFLRWLEQ